METCGIIFLENARLLINSFFDTNLSFANQFKTLIQTHQQYRDFLRGESQTDNRQLFIDTIRLMSDALKESQDTIEAFRTLYENIPILETIPTTPVFTLFKFDKNFKCEICSKQFTRKANLQRHQLLHDTRRPFGCLYCSFRYTNEKSLKQHLTFKHCKP